MGQEMSLLEDKKHGGWPMAADYVSRGGEEVRKKLVRRLVRMPVRIPPPERRHGGWESWPISANFLSAISRTSSSTG
jgi:hypothetical protein